MNSAGPLRKNCYAFRRRWAVVMYSICWNFACRAFTRMAPNREI